jgi:hypothetical protein
LWLILNQKNTKTNILITAPFATLVKFMAVKLAAAAGRLLIM